jgi:hydroxypyruvate reductase/glycerate 2-kinase
MTHTPDHLRAEAVGIWTAAVSAVKPAKLVRTAVERLPAAVREAIDAAPRILIVGCGKAGAWMTWHLEGELRHKWDRIEGLVNIPAGSESAYLEEVIPPEFWAGQPRRLVGLRPLKTQMHPARPPGHNHPTADGVCGTNEILRLLASAGPDDVAFCLLSGGGSALLPAPVTGITLEDKQAVTAQLHACGATIQEMNAVRKHLSRVKGGRLAAAFRGRLLVGLIISDVVGDPLDVIASGPTAPDPTTYSDALAVIDRYDLRQRVPPAVIDVLARGAAGELPETVKELPPTVHNVVIGTNADALGAARAAAEGRGYRVLDLGPYIEGETRHVATAVAGIIRSIRERDEPSPPPVCVLIGGETTVTLEPGSGKGGRNQEFVLAVLDKLGADGMSGACVLCGGTDGEDGPTDAAGAVGTAETLRLAHDLHLSPKDHLRRHDAYPFFKATNGLLETGLTGTNVMDVRIVLVT